MLLQASGVRVQVVWTARNGGIKNPEGVLCGEMAGGRATL